MLYKEENVIKPIAYIRTEFPSKFGIPRQSSLKDNLFGTIVFEEKYSHEEAFRELQGFSHLWIIWHFSETEKTEAALTVRPPRLGGNKRVGVFASRSPYRPNSLGLSCVKLERICSGGGLCNIPYCPLGKKSCKKLRGTSLLVSGIDMKDKTPIFDIKPYIPITDCHPDASEGYTSITQNHRLTVILPDNISSVIPPEKIARLTSVLEDDPRPGYRHSSEKSDKIYHIEFDIYDIPFQVKSGKLIVMDGIKTNRT